MSDLSLEIHGDAGPAAATADHYERLAKAQGVFVRREGNRIFVNGPIIIGDETLAIENIGTVAETGTMKWPQRIIDSLGREPQVGDWIAEVGIEDFQQIVDAPLLAEILNNYDEDDSGGRFWKTEAEGRAELAADTEGLPK